MKEIKIGDTVMVLDAGLLMLQRFAPKGSNPNNIGIVESIDEDLIIVNFPIGKEKISKHSQAAPYPFRDVRKIETPEWLKKLL